MRVVKAGSSPCPVAMFPRFGRRPEVPFRIFSCLLFFLSVYFAEIFSDPNPPNDEPAKFSQRDSIRSAGKIAAFDRFYFRRFRRVPRACRPRKFNVPREKQKTKKTCLKHNYPDVFTTRYSVGRKSETNQKNPTENS